MGIEKIKMADLQPYIENKTTRAEKTGIKKLDDFLRYKKKNLLIVGGLANVGKTTGTLWLMFTWSMLCKSSPKWLVFSNENENIETSVMLLEWYHEKPVYEQTQKELQSAIQWVEDHFQFLKNDYSTDLLSILKLASDVYKNIWQFDGLLIDPYSSLKFCGYNEHYSNATLMRQWIRKYETKLIVTMHAGTEAARMVDKNRSPLTPLPSSLEMGAMWMNRADDLCIMHRATQDETLRNKMEVHVCKIKQTRSGGKTTDRSKPVELYYQEKWGGFLWEKFDVQEISNR